MAGAHALRAPDLPRFALSAAPPKTAERCAGLGAGLRLADTYDTSWYTSTTMLRHSDH
jgi:hypothetical protein